MYIMPASISNIIDEHMHVSVDLHKFEFNINSVQIHLHGQSLWSTSYSTWSAKADA